YSERREHSPHRGGSGSMAKPAVSLPEFFAPFRSGPEELIFFRAVKAKDCPDHLLPFEWKGQTNPRESIKFGPYSYPRLEHGMQSVNKILQMNQHYGVYFNVNAGGVKDVAIKRFVAAFAESDPKDGEDREAFLTAEIAKKCPLPPSVELLTYKSVHRHWLITSDCSREEWIII